jgi:serine/threonine protein kinase
MSVSSPPGVVSTASSSNEFDLPGTNYEVIRLLGAGGMGRVYEVEHRLLGSRWAAKVLAHELGYRQDLVRRLVREARLLGRLRHPNLVNVIDVGTSSKGRAYFVMDLLKGRTLRDELRRVWPYPIAPAYRTLQHVLAGLSVAHEAGLIHRDIKPDNVFLCDDGVVKLLDFGIAKNLLATPASGTPLTPLSGPGVMATVRYAAPECIDGQTASVLSDLYSTGVVLWEMLSGALPFDCGTKYRMLLTIVGEGLRPLDNVPPEVRDLVQRAVARDPAQRFPSARAFSDALEDALARMPGGGVAPARGAASWQRAERPAAVHAPVLTPSPPLPFAPPELLPLPTSSQERPDLASPPPDDAFAPAGEGAPGPSDESNDTEIEPFDLSRFELEAEARELEAPAEVAEPAEIAEPAEVAEPAQVAEPAKLAPTAQVAEPAKLAPAVEVDAPAKLAATIEFDAPAKLAAPPLADHEFDTVTLPPPPLQPAPRAAGPVAETGEQEKRHLVHRGEAPGALRPGAQAGGGAASPWATEPLETPVQPMPLADFVSSFGSTHGDKIFINFDPDTLGPREQRWRYRKVRAALLLWSESQRERVAPRPAPVEPRGPKKEGEGP